MRKFWKVTVRDQWAPAEVMKVLERRWPEGRSEFDFSRTFAHDDPTVSELVALLRAHGMRPNYATELTTGEYEMAFFIRYEPQDIETAKYLTGFPYDYLNGWGRQDDGGLRLGRRGLRKKAKLAFVDCGGLAVATAFRRAIEAAGLVGPVFRPTVVVTGEYYDDLKDVPWEKVDMEPFWEMQSSVALPPLSPRCRLVDSRNWSRTVGDPHRETCDIAWGEFPRGELHYLRGDLNKVPPFDLAYTWERLGDARREGFTFVYSQRFKAFLDQHKVRMDWSPVYLDDSPEPQGPPQRLTFE